MPSAQASKKISITGFGKKESRNSSCKRASTKQALNSSKHTDALKSTVANSSCVASKVENTDDLTKNRERNLASLIKVNKALIFCKNCKLVGDLE